MNGRSCLSILMFLCAVALSAAETSHGRRLTPNDVDLWQSGGYSYDGSGNVYAIGTDSFAYDRAGRLTNATVATHPQTFTYDVFGNIRQVVTGADILTPAIDILTNHIGATGNGPGAVSVATYDGAGNMVSSDGIFTYTYDALNMVTSLNGAGQDELYVYGPGEERIATVTAIHASVPHWSWTIREGGRVLRRLEDSTWSEDYVYRDGGLLATIQSDATTRHFHLDHLGSARVVTNDEGRTVARHTYYPFGSEIDAPPNDPERVRFTGHERDASLYYMHARFYGDMAGRFLSVDPVLGRQREPQSWNRYTYGLNNPLRYTDPDGRWVTNCSVIDKQCNADAAAFEASLARDLKSRDPEVVAAARAYGAKGDASIVVGFGTTGKEAGATTPSLQGNVDGTMGMTATVMLKAGLRGTELDSAVGHEGRHVLDAQGFAASFINNGMSWDLSKNLTSFQTEMNAYRITHKIYAAAGKTFDTGCSGCVLGARLRTPADVDLATRKILADPSGAYKVTPQNQGARQFPDWTSPP